MNTKVIVGTRNVERGFPSRDSRTSLSPGRKEIPRGTYTVRVGWTFWGRLHAQRDSLSAPDVLASRVHSGTDMGTHWTEAVFLGSRSTHTPDSFAPSANGSGR